MQRIAVAFVLLLVIFFLVVVLDLVEFINLGKEERRGWIFLATPRRRPPKCVASLLAGPDRSIIEAVDGRTEVLFDSGITSGQDLLKALALGARAGLIGKAFLYGLGAGGQSGVAQAIELIRRELSVTMALTGQRDAAHISPDIVWRRT